MIDGEPRIIARDGRAVVVDQSGAELVCRRQTSNPSSGGPRYHRVDVEAYAAERTVVPACGSIMRSPDVKWLLRRRKTLAATWTGCAYHACYGEYDPYDQPAKPDPYSGLAAQLKSMSIAEFETTTQRTRGER